MIPELSRENARYLLKYGPKKILSLFRKRRSICQGKVYSSHNTGAFPRRSGDPRSSSSSTLVPSNPHEKVPKSGSKQASYPYCIPPASDHPRLGAPPPDYITWHQFFGWKEVLMGKKIIPTKGPSIAAKNMRRRLEYLGTVAAGGYDYRIGMRECNEAKVEAESLREDLERVEEEEMREKARMEEGRLDKYECVEESDLLPGVKWANTNRSSWGGWGGNDAACNGFERRYCEYLQVG